MWGQALVGSLRALIQTLMLDPGGLVALKIFLQGCSVETATTAFKELSCKVFSTSSTSQQNFLAIFTRIVKSITKDELYDSSLLDRILIEQFGTRNIFDHNPALHRGTRVGVVATTVDENTSARTRLFCNYNGAAVRETDAGRCPIGAKLTC